MICQFSFKNFLSYKRETTFDFQAAAIPELEDSLIKRDKASDLLPVGVIYGPNGGGKSNLLKAFACLVTMVVKPVADLGKTRESAVIQLDVPCIPFLLDKESKYDNSEFQVFFRAGKNEYQYNLAVHSGEIVSESLLWRTVGGRKTGVVFNRETNFINLGASINKNSVNTQINPKMTYLSFLAINYDFPVVAEVISWFESCIIQSYANPIVDKRVFLVDDFTKRAVIRALNDLDIDISDYTFNEQEKKLFTVRNVADRKYELPFEYESDGTRKLLSTLPIILLALQEGRLVVIDELDAKLHPKLLRYIIKLFHNPQINKNGAQLLFSSHDLTTMKNDVFRRDEIWFACENECHESSIYSLYDIRDENGKHVNNTAAYDKQYLEGRYGADPYLQNILGGEWNELEAD
ncbi:MAG: ATP-binding protein [Clostridiales bacterium]|nr:ATP-binding protein [Clostridiales bacterium]